MPALERLGLAGLLDPGTSREQWRPTFQDFERRYHDFRARYQVHLAATAREREILAKLVKASDLLLAAEDTWAKEIAATTDLENSRRAREAAQAHHARRQSVVTQVELDIAEENLSRARRNQEQAATEGAIKAKTDAGVPRQVAEMMVKSEMQQGGGQGQPAGPGAMAPAPPQGMVA